jgi:hypothetical protein
VRTSGFFDLLDQGGFQILRIGIHFTRGNFFVTGALKTKLANAQATFRAHRRAKNAASHRSRFIEITKPGLGIECRTRLIIRELGEPLFRLLAFIQQATDWITGKVLRQPGNRVPSALARPSGALRRTHFQIRKSLPEPRSIELIDGKHSDAALRAPGTAGDPLAASARGVGQRRVHDLY